MPRAAAIPCVCVGLIVLSLLRLVGLNLAMRADVEKEKPMEDKAKQFKLLISVAIETIWTIGASIAASILSS